MISATGSLRCTPGRPMKPGNCPAVKAPTSRSLLTRPYPGLMAARGPTSLLPSPLISLAVFSPRWSTSPVWGKRERESLPSWSSSTVCWAGERSTSGAPGKQQQQQQPGGSMRTMSDDVSGGARLAQRPRRQEQGQEEEEEKEGELMGGQLPMVVAASEDGIDGMRVRGAASSSRGRSTEDRNRGERNRGERNREERNRGERSRNGGSRNGGKGEEGGVVGERLWPLMEGVSSETADAFGAKTRLAARPQKTRTGVAAGPRGLKRRVASLREAQLEMTSSSSLIELLTDASRNRASAAGSASAAVSTPAKVSPSPAGDNSPTARGNLPAAGNGQHRAGRAVPLSGNAQMSAVPLSGRQENGTHASAHTSAVPLSTKNTSVTSLTDMALLSSDVSTGPFLSSPVRQDGELETRLPFESETQFLSKHARSLTVDSEATTETKVGAFDKTQVGTSARSLTMDEEARILDGGKLTTETQVGAFDRTQVVGTPDGTAATAASPSAAPASASAASTSLSAFPVRGTSMQRHTSILPALVAGLSTSNGTPESISRVMSSFPREALSSRLIAAAMKQLRRDWTKVLALYDWMRGGGGLVPSVHVYTLVLGRVGGAQQWGTVARVLREMDEAGVEKDAFVYNTLIVCSSNAGRYEDALSWFQEAEASNVGTSQVLYTSIIKMCTKAGNHDEAVRVSDKLRAHPDFNPDAMTLCTLIAAYSQSGNLGAAVEMFQVMRQRPLQFWDPVVWNAAVSAYARAAQPAPAEAVVKEMEEVWWEQQGLGVPRLHRNGVEDGASGGGSPSGRGSGGGGSGSGSGGGGGGVELGNGSGGVELGNGASGVELGSGGGVRSVRNSTELASEASGSFQEGAGGVQVVQGTEEQDEDDSEVGLSLRLRRSAVWQRRTEEDAEKGANEKGLSLCDSMAEDGGGQVLSLEERVRLMVQKARGPKERGPNGLSGNGSDLKEFSSKRGNPNGSSSNGLSSNGSSPNGLTPVEESGMDGTRMANATGHAHPQTDGTVEKEVLEGKGNGAIGSGANGNGAVGNGANGSGAIGSGANGNGASVKSGIDSVTAAGVGTRSSSQRSTKVQVDTKRTSLFGPTSHAYNALIYAYAQTGDVTGAEKTMQRMLLHGFLPTQHTYNTLLSLYASCPSNTIAEAVEKSEALVVEIQRSNQASLDVYLFCTLIGLYNRADLPERAARAYRTMLSLGLKPDLHVYSAMIALYGRRGMLEDAIVLYEEVKAHGLKPDVTILTSMLGVYHRKGCLEEAAAVAAEIEELGQGIDPVVSSAVISFFSKAGRLGDAVRVFEAARKQFGASKARRCSPNGAVLQVERGGSSIEECSPVKEALPLPPSSGPSLESFESLLSHSLENNETVLQQQGDPSAALEQQGNPSANSIGIDGTGSYQHEVQLVPVEIDAPVSSDDPSVALNLKEGTLKGSLGSSDRSTHYNLSSMNANAASVLSSFTLPPSVPSTTALSASTPSITDLSASVPSSNSLPPSRSSTTALSASASSAALLSGSEGKELESRNGKGGSKRWRRRKATVDTVLLSSMIDAYGKAGELESALTLFQELQSLESPGFKNVVAYTTMITLLGRHNRVEHAKDLFVQLKSSRTHLDVLAYNSILGALAKCGEHELARKHFEDMLVKGPAPTVYTYTILIDMYGKAGDLLQASKIFGLMLQHGLPPSAVTYNSLIHMFSRAGMYNDANNLYRRMAEEGMQPNFVTYSIMLTMHAEAGNPWDAIRVFREMEKSKFEPDAAMLKLVAKMYGKIGQYHQMQALRSRPMVQIVGRLAPTEQTNEGPSDEET